VFNEYKVELGIAAKILDTLNDAGYDETFLLSWINFFFDVHLKGARIAKKEMTSLQALQKTFEDYSGRYVGHGV